MSSSSNQGNHGNQGNQDNQGSNDQARTTLQKLQTLRDEIRLRIHLGGMELKGLWSDLENKIFDAEKKIEGAAEDVFAKLQSLLPEVEAFRKKLPEQDAQQGPGQGQGNNSAQNQGAASAKA